MSSRAAARGKAAANSIRLTSRTSKAVATSRASPSRCFLFCRGSRAARSAPIAVATVAIPPTRKPPQARRSSPITERSSAPGNLIGGKAYAASLKAKGLPFAVLWAVVLVAAEVLGPLALIIGAWPRWTAVALVAFTAVTLWLSHRSSLVGAVFRPRQNADLYRTLAIMGGLLFYFASGPGAWSLKGSSTGRGA